MLPGYVSKFLVTDTEFIERFDNFAFDEVINMPDIGGKEVDGRIRHIRKGLNHAERELITFCFLAAQGGCEPQLTSHAAANMRNGNEVL